jgi:hypothetical protein
MKLWPLPNAIFSVISIQLDNEHTTSTKPQCPPPPHGLTLHIFARSLYMPPLVPPIHKLTSITGRSSRWDNSRSLPLPNRYTKNPSPIHRRLPSLWRLHRNISWCRKCHCRLCPRSSPLLRDLRLHQTAFDPHAKSPIYRRWQTILPTWRRSKGRAMEGAACSYGCCFGGRNCGLCCEGADGGR